MNGPRAKAVAKEWRSTNRHTTRAIIAAYRAAKLRRTPPWVNREELKSVYKACPEGMHVDHIVPLQGRNVSGLHVPWNLQYLTPSENSSKGNRFG